MAFNDFLDKVMETSATAMGKAKDTTKRLATINDLKSKIRGYNNDKNKLFTQLGMDIYIAKKHNESYENLIDEFVSKVDTINIRIRDLKEKLALFEEDANLTDVEADVVETDDEI